MSVWVKSTIPAFPLLQEKDVKDGRKTTDNNRLRLKVPNLILLSNYRFALRQPLA